MCGERQMSNYHANLINAHLRDYSCYNPVYNLSEHN